MVLARRMLELYAGTEERLVSATDTTDLVSRERGRLFGIAYRLLGTVSDAEDAVQEAFLRWEEADQGAIENPAGWVTTVITRYCLDQLKSARKQRETYIGPWLPEPLLTVGGMVADDPAERVTLDESVSLAMLVVLETLSAAERAVFVLHEVFGIDFEEIAGMVDRTPAACRQLASRARRHVRERRPRFDPDAAEQRRVVTALLDAVSKGDLNALLPLLDPSVVLHADGGGRVRAAGRPVVGVEQVAKVMMGGRTWYPGYATQLIAMNGGTGVLVTLEGKVIGLIAVTAAGGRITEIDMIVNPEKLRGAG
jgi:RNA polymerase sigma-70 factor (ECF subfamily)